MFTFLLARLLGAQVSGEVLQGVAVFTIVLSVSRLGLDTAAVWLLPRLVVTNPGLLRSAVTGLVLPAGVSGVVVAVLWLAAVPILVDGDLTSGTAGVLVAMACFLPAAGVMMVALAGTRAFGGVLPFNVVNNFLVPGLRLLGLLAVVAMGGAGVSAALSWTVPWVIGAVAASLMLLRLLRRHPGRSGGGAAWPDRGLRRDIARYALPRTAMSGLEQMVIWADVILVGLILGTVDAGVYGSVARFVSAGVLFATALRIVVAPRFSAMLAEGRRDDVQDLYSVTARWIFLFGAPIYLVLAVFSPTVLAWLGPDFASGRWSMVALCIGSLVSTLR